MQPQQLKDWLSAAGGRRFLITLGAGLVHTTLLICRVLSQSNYLTLTIATVGAYITANTIEKVKSST